MSHLQDAAIQVAETIQSAHINKAPSRRDMAPSTAADTKQPVVFDRAGQHSFDAEEVGEDEIPLSILRPLPREEQRKPPHMQLPDLRFEQSYLKSISEAEDWKMVAYITFKDQGVIGTQQLNSLVKLWGRRSGDGGGESTIGPYQTGIPHVGGSGMRWDVRFAKPDGRRIEKYYAWHLALRGVAPPLLA